MTDALQITRKNYWQVNGNNHATEVEAFQDASNQAIASPGASVQVQPPAYDVTYTPAAVVQPSDPAPPPVLTDPTPVGTLAPAVVTGTANGQPVNVTVQPGQRVQLVPGSFQLGSVKYYADGAVVIENSYVGAGNPTPGDITCDLHIAVGDAAWDESGLVVWYGCWTRPYWVVVPVAKPVDKSLFPTYGAGSETASRVDAYAKADNSRMGVSLWCKAMQTTGERDDLGLLDASSSAALTNPSDAANAVVRGMADASAPFPFHSIDTETGDMLLSSNYPKASALPACYGVGNPFVKYTSACPYSLQQATAHAPAFNALAAAMYGTDYDKASLAQWANYIGRLWQNPGYCLPGGPTNVLHGQTRGKAWSLRTIVQASRLSDHPDLFASWANMLADHMATSWTAQTGIAIDGFDAVYSGGAGFAPYQQHFLIQSLGYAIQLGFTGFQRTLDYFAPTICASILDAQHELATIYTNGYMQNGVAAKDWVQALQFGAATDPTTAAALACAEDSAAMQTALGTQGGQPGDFSGYPTAPTGYAAIMQPAVAYVARYATDQTRAQAAWTKYAKYQRQNYATDPKYNIMPRAA